MNKSTPQIVYLDHEYQEQHAPLNGVPIVDAIEMLISVDLTPSGFCLHEDHEHRHRDA